MGLDGSGAGGGRGGLVAALLLLSTGCLSRRLPPEATAPLTPEDAARARAWAQFAQGLVHEWEGAADLEGALRAYRRAIVADPNEAELRHLAARALLELGRPAEAQDLLVQAVRDLPHSSATRLALGRVAAHRDDHALAAREFRAAARTATTPLDRLKARMLAAFAHFTLALDSEALADLAAVAMLPDTLADPGAEGDAAFTPRIRAIRFALELSELRLDAKPPEGALTYVLWAAGRTTNALERADVWERHGAAALRRRLADIAAPALRASATHDPLRSRALLAAIALERAIHWDAVTDAMLAEERSRNPGCVALHVALAYRYAERNQHAVGVPYAVAAVRLLRASAPDAPLPPELWLLHGSLLERSGALAEAEAVFLEALEQHPAFAPVQNYLAYMWAEQARELERAEALVKAALATDPRNAAYLDTLGWVYYQMGRYEEALLWLLRAVEDGAQEAVIFDHIGDTLAKLGRKSESAAYWAMSYRLDPANATVAAKLEAMGFDLTRLRAPP